jgi:hypothetical protein
MIYIDKYNPQDIILTLNEKRLLNDSNFILQLYSNQEKETTLYWLTGDTSFNTNRWNQFNITGTGITDLIQGSYDYMVYETTGTTLAISATTGNICETGKLIIIGTGTTSYTLNNTNTEYTFE